MANAICDRCSFKYKIEKLTYQYQYSGVGLFNTNLLVCRKCLDVPNPQLLSIVAKPDGVGLAVTRLDPAVTPIE